MHKLDDGDWDAKSHGLTAPKPEYRTYGIAR